MPPERSRMPRDAEKRRPRNRRSAPIAETISEAIQSSAVRSWFGLTFPDGPTPAQSMAWPAIDSGENVLLVSPTGTGKTLAAFLAILDRLYREHEAGALDPGLRCVYLSPLRSLGYDIERSTLR